jgi:hypothetical protein
VNGRSIDRGFMHMKAGFGWRQAWFWPDRQSHFRNPIGEEWAVIQGQRLSGRQSGSHLRVGKTSQVDCFRAIISSSAGTVPLYRSIHSSRREAPGSARCLRRTSRAWNN